MNARAEATRVEVSGSFDRKRRCSSTSSVNEGASAVAWACGRDAEHGYGPQGNAPPPGPYGQQGGLPGMMYNTVPRPGGQFAGQRPMQNPAGMQGAPAMPRGVMGGPQRQGSLPLPYGGVPGQPPGMMGGTAASGQTSMAQGGVGSTMGGGQRGVMLDRSASQPVQDKRGFRPSSARRAGCPCQARAWA